MSLETIEQMFGRDDDGQPRCPLDAETRKNLRDACDVLIRLPLDAVKALRTVGGFLMAGPANRLQNDTSLSIEQVRLEQGISKGLDLFLSEIEVADLETTKEWLSRSHQEEI